MSLVRAAAKLLRRLQSAPHVMSCCAGSSGQILGEPGCNAVHTDTFLKRLLSLAHPRTLPGLRRRLLSQLWTW